jgi:hypothetical protein
VQVLTTYDRVLRRKLTRNWLCYRDFATANWDPMYVLNFLSDMGTKRSEQQISDKDIGNHFCNHDDFAALSCLGAAQGIRFQKVKQ